MGLTIGLIFLAATFLGRFGRRTALIRGLGKGAKNPGGGEAVRSVSVGSAILSAT
jgi:hypothetical protein